MSKKTLSSIMEGYFEKPRSTNPGMSFLNEVGCFENDLPVTANRSDWVVESSPERLTKKFEFPSTDARNYFISEMLQYEKETSHNAMICIEGKDVTVEVYTHDLMSVTELDKEYAGYCDLVFSDMNLWS